MRQISVIFAEPYKTALKQSAVPAPGDEEVLIKTLMSAISPGTEMLVYRGQLSTGIPADATIPALAQPLEYPLAYGYACVGQVVEIGQSVDPKWMGQTVFCFNPHESHFKARAESLTSLPAGMEPDDAVQLATMETAVNFLMDGRPVIGENVVLFGLGIVGLLTAALLSKLPLNRLIAIDPCLLRREMAMKTGVSRVLDPAALETVELELQLSQARSDGRGADLVYELSGNPTALNQAIAATGFGGRIVVGSWYGSQKVSLDLGDRFHRDRIRLISSQVSTLPENFSFRWTKERRISVALDMIRKLNPARFITHRFNVQDAAKAYELVDQHPQEAVQVVLTYE
jgi:2-desacetyl-2-hydroxyethyl bacteriochlorophyllide A dehydrogenase